MLSNIDIGRLAILPVGFQPLVNEGREFKVVHVLRDCVPILEDLNPLAREVLS